MLEEFNTRLQLSSARRRGNALSFKQRKRRMSLRRCMAFFLVLTVSFSKPSGILKRLQVQQKKITTHWVRSQTAPRRREKETVTRRTRGCWRWWRFWPEDGRRFFFGFFSPLPLLLFLLRLLLLLFTENPGSGFVGGGRQKQGGGASFQVWQRDRHVSVD